MLSVQQLNLSSSLKCRILNFRKRLFVEWVCSLQTSTQVEIRLALKITGEKRGLVGLVLNLPFPIVLPDTLSEIAHTPDYHECVWPPSRWAMWECRWEQWSQQPHKWSTRASSDSQTLGVATAQLWLSLGRSSNDTEQCNGPQTFVHNLLEWGLLLEELEMRKENCLAKLRRQSLAACFYKLTFILCDNVKSKLDT